MKAVRNNGICAIQFNGGEMTPERAFALAVKSYPRAFQEQRREGISSWQVVDAYEASNGAPEYWGKLVLAKYTGEEKTPRLYWGFVV
jgi:hypothetical protein